MQATVRKNTFSLDDGIIGQADDDFKEYRKPTTKLLTCEDRLKQAGLAVLALGGVAACTTLAALEAYNGLNNPKKFSLLMGGAGASSAAFLHIILDPKWRSTIYKVQTYLSYKILFIGTNLYLNIPTTEFQKNVIMGAFTAYSCFFPARDIASVISSNRSEHPQFEKEPEHVGQIIPMSPPTTRDKSVWAYGWLGTQATIATLSTAAFFWLRDKDYGELHKHGVYGNLIALFSGSITGEIVTRWLDDLRIRREKEADELGEQAKESCCSLLKALRFSKTSFTLMAPFLYTFCLQFLSLPSRTTVDNPANSLRDYMIISIPGGIFGAYTLYLKRNQENSQSSYHTTRIANRVSQLKDATVGICSKITDLAKRYLAPIACFAALDAFMTYAAIDSENLRIFSAVLILILSSHASFASTDLLQKFYEPKSSDDIKNNFDIPPSWIKENFTSGMYRFGNLIYFLLSNPFILAAPYQWLRTKFDINNQAITTASPQVLAMCDISWLSWGLSLGNIEALAAGILTDPLSYGEMARIIATEIQRNTTNATVNG